MNEASDTDTRTSLLDAAEKLFAENGVEATSVRDITKAAGANQGAINYHFQSKDKLILEVFARRMQPVTEQALGRLDALEANEASPPLEAVIEALVRPMVEDEASGKRRPDEYMQLISRSFNEPSTEIKEFMAKMMGSMVTRFDAAIMRAVPGLTRQELFWQMQFVIGALHHGLDRWSRFDSMPLPPGIAHKMKRPDRDGFIQRLVSFAAAGIRASE